MREDDATRLRLFHVVSTAKRRGAETFTADLVRLLREEGVAQRVAVLWGSVSPEVHYEAPVIELGAKGSGGPSAWFHRVTSLRRDLATWAPDLVIAHGSDPLKHVVLADPMKRRPLVYRNIGLASPAVTHGVRRCFYTGLIRRATKVVAVADAVALETTATFGISRDRLVTIPNGVDGDRLRPTRRREEVRRDLRIPVSAPVWLAVGSLTPEKNPLGQVEVAARVISARPGSFFLFAGDGPMRPQVEAAVTHAGIGSQVRLLGSRPDVGDLLSASDALVLASSMEGMPAVVIEAGLAGLPVVAYDVAGVSEVVEDGITGLLAEPGDVDGLARRVHQVLDDPAAGREMGQRALNRCRERFDLRAQLGRYLDLYSEVIRCHRRRDGP